MLFVRLPIKKACTKRVFRHARGLWTGTRSAQAVDMFVDSVFIRP